MKRMRKLQLLGIILLLSLTSISQGSQKTISMTEEKARIVASLIEKGKGAQRELDSTKALLIEYKHLHDTLTARLDNEKENSQSYKAELSKADEQITNLQKQKADLEK